ncbi:carboxypeptidase-like regulatory domain-containing protein, partial [bacterium]|nr:carboxypeptidase-like regulatory domain-containing protein [bacterium]
MKTSQVVFLVVIFLFTGMNIVSAQVTIDPVGVAVSTEEGDSIVVEVTLTNNGDSDVFFALDFDEPPEEDERNAGPRRDDPGDVIDEFRMENYGAGVRGPAFAKDWDTGWMWATIWEGWVEIIDPADDYATVEAWQPDAGNLFSAAWLNGIFYLSVAQNSTVLRYDGEFNRLDDIRMNYTVRGMSSSPEMELLMITEAAGDYPIHIYTVDENGNIDEEVARIPTLRGFLAANNEQANFIWVDQHPDGEIWTQLPEFADGGGIFQVDIDTDEWEAVETVQEWETSSSNRWDGIGHDGYNIWAGTANGATIEVKDDGINESYHKWVMADLEEEEGMIEANGSMSFNLIFQPIEMENGVYEIYMIVELYESEDRDVMNDCLTISTIMSYNSPTFNVSGIVTDAGNDNSIENAKLDIFNHFFARFTNENGEYSAENMPLGAYEVIISATDFLTTVEEVNIEEEGEFEWDITLLHSEFTPSQRQFFRQLEPDMSYNFDFCVDNGGNGPLTYSAERRLLGDANAE